ncbi:MAG TPA: carbonic anhydrase family protein [Aquabacterium sp.]|jgi:carbonic anhydrase|nr:carbonic anhydrase family protein [Aquabacterium sp.]HRH29884.1 carbonic anhydrase family protein [Aquabacterium sp.]
MSPRRLSGLSILALSLSLALSVQAESVPDKAASSAGVAPPSGVSMVQLRDLIAQKVSEVQAKQEGPAVVRVSPSAPRVRKAPAGAAKSAQAKAGHDVHWAYGGDTGPENWGQLKPEFKSCMLGKRQSPIDIRDGIAVQLEPIQFDYRPTPFKVLDNGHTVQVNLEPGNSIAVLGQRYELLQFHFHRPSEERINGRQYPMVAHLVHKDAEGKLAVVAVLMDQGVAHPMVQLVWNSLPLEKGMEQRSPVMMDMNLMLPAERLYYTYMGSLTTPPCTEGVLWMVMKQPATLSHEQMGVFARMYPMNARPIQPAAGRMIKEGQ